MMKNSRKKPEHDVDRYIYEHYANEAGNVRLRFPLIKSPAVSQNADFSLRRNKIIDYVFVSFLAVAAMVCLFFADSFTRLEKAAGEYYAYKEFDKKIPEALDHVKTYIEILKRQED
ncbi:hypothetical protein ACFL6I_03665 [candidate division KSB1 bacterium]